MPKQADRVLLVAQKASGPALRSHNFHIFNLSDFDGDRWVFTLKTPPNQSALQHSVLRVWSSALAMSWTQLLFRPYPKESVKLTELMPIAYFE